MSSTRPSLAVVPSAVMTKLHATFDEPVTFAEAVAQVKAWADTQPEEHPSVPTDKGSRYWGFG